MKQEPEDLNPAAPQSGAVLGSGPQFLSVDRYRAQERLDGFKLFAFSWLVPILSLSIHKCPDPEDNPVSVFLNLTLGWILIFWKIYTNHMAKDRQTVWSMNLESWTRAAAQTPHFSQNAPISPVV